MAAVKKATGRKKVKSSSATTRRAESLTDNPDFLKQAVDAASDPLWCVDSGARVIYANAAAVDLLGYSMEKLLTLTVFDLDPVFPKKKWKGLTERIRKEGRFELETIQARSDGTRIPVEVRGSYAPFAGKDYFFVSTRDITSRKKREEALQESEEKYRHLIDLSPDPVVILQNGKYAFVNDSFTKVFGYTREDVAKGLSFMKLVDKKDYKRVQKRYLDRLAGKEVPRTFRLDLSTKDGGVLGCETSAALITHKGAAADLVTIRDISEREMVARALRESETKFRDLAEKSPNMIFINAKRRVVFANEKCEEVTGYSRAEFYSPKFNFLDLIAPEDKARVEEIYRKRTHGGVIPSYEYELVTKAGERISVVINSAEITFDGQTALLGIVTDVTQRKEAEMLLTLSSKELARQRDALEHKNLALREILAQIREDKEQMQEQFSAAVDRHLRPVLTRLKKKVRASEMSLVEVLERGLDKLGAEYDMRTHAGLDDLTPRQQEIGNMIRRGMASQEIARTLGLSVRTVEVHRNTIRKRLGLSGEKANLIVYLRSLEKPET